MRRVVIVALAAAVVVSALVAARDVRRRYWSTRGATVVHFTLPRTRRHRDLREILVVPRGGGLDRELVVFLHVAIVPVWIDVVRDDPVFSADLTLAHELRAHGADVRLVVHGGGHSGWSSRFREYFRFYAAAC
jgi:hypothetical protein